MKDLIERQDYELTPGGRRLLKATPLDIIVSIFLPGWGVIIGAIALLIKGEKRRGVTMMAIGACVLLFIIFSAILLGEA